MKTSKIKLTTNTAMINGSNFAKQQWAKAKKLFPNVELGYIGSAPNGDMYFQQWGNATPFILPA